jgi:hypothetical protein
MNAKTALQWPPDLTIGHLLVVLVALFAADSLVSTSLINNGLGYEGNPFLSGMSGPNSLSIKVAGSLLAAVVLWDVHKVRPKQAVIAATASVLVYTGIIFWNLSVFLTGRA